MTVERTDDDETDRTEYPQYAGPDEADIVRNLEEGDRVHVELTRREGRVRWRSAWVTDAGEDYAEFGSYRVEVTDPDKTGRAAVTLFEQMSGEFVDEKWTEGFNGIERTPAEAFEDQSWYQWEIRVSEVRGGGASSDQTVFPEAPTREAATEKAKRWARINGYTPVVYQEDQVTHPDDASGVPA